MANKQKALLWNALRFHPEHPHVSSDYFPEHLCLYEFLWAVRAGMEGYVPEVSLGNFFMKIIISCRLFAFMPELFKKMGGLQFDFINPCRGG